MNFRAHVTKEQPFHSKDDWPIRMKRQFSLTMLNGVHFKRMKRIYFCQTPGKSLLILGGCAGRSDRKINNKRFYVLFNIISIISGQWESDSKRLCAMQR